MYKENAKWDKLSEDRACDMDFDPVALYMWYLGMRTWYAKLTDGVMSGSGACSKQHTKRE